LADSVNVFNDSPIEDPMAIEPAPVEINLREPRKSGRDFSTLLWLCGWGVATAVALSALALTSQTQTATDRLRSIFAVSEPSGVAQMPPRIAQLELETQMLTEQVRALNADRDRLAGRIALLQSSVDDMTGAIKRQAAATAAVLAARAAAPASQTQPSIAPPVAGASPVAAAPEAKTDPVITSSVPLPPARAAAAQAAAGPEPAASTSEFGLDLGAASTLDGVQQRWTTVKANFGPLLSNLHPLAAPERRQGKTGYRLVVGPLPNSPAATGLCAHFNAAHTPCRAVKFEGEQIAQR
jgi:SPOR domain